MKVENVCLSSRNLHHIVGLKLYQPKDFYAKIYVNRQAKGFKIENYCRRPLKTLRRQICVCAGHTVGNETTVARGNIKWSHHN